MKFLTLLGLAFFPFALNATPITKTYTAKAIECLGEYKEDTKIDCNYLKELTVIHHERNVEIIFNTTGSDFLLKTFNHCEKQIYKAGQYKCVVTHIGSLHQKEFPFFSWQAKKRVFNDYGSEIAVQNRGYSILMHEGALTFISSGSNNKGWHHVKHQLTEK